MTRQALSLDVAFSQESPTASLNQILVIGDLMRWKAEGRITVALAEFQFIEFAALTSAILDTVAPDIILSPLMGDNFDVLDIAQRLSNLNFEGRYRVIADSLPDAQMVRREVCNHAPSLDFDLLTMPPAANDAGLDRT